MKSVKEEKKDVNELLLAGIIKNTHKKDILEQQTASFRASFSRCIRRLRDRGLIKIWINKKTKYVLGVTLTPDGKKIAKNIKINPC